MQEIHHPKHHTTDEKGLLTNLATHLEHRISRRIFSFSYSSPAVSGQTAAFRQQLNWVNVHVQKSKVG